MGFTRSIIVVFVLFGSGLLIADTQTTLPNLPSGCRPISLYSTDHDRDGIADLIVKCETFQGINHYFYRCNPDSIYPNSPEATKHKLVGSFNSFPFSSAEGPIDDPKSKGSTEVRFRLNKDSIDDVVTLRGDGGIVVQMSAPSLIFTVNSTADPGAGICDAAECTLREAITAANATPAADEIQFNLPGSGPYTISPTSKLPIVLQPLTIDATTQPGYSGSPIVQLNGINAGAGADGLEIRANSTIWGFVINRFTANGLYLFQTGISHIEGNFLGTNISGTSALGNGFCGITISSANNIIGGSIPSARNVISGNLRSGICIVGDDSDNNSIVNSYIGTDVTGNMDLGNLEWGISISQADSTQIGGMVAAQGNVISGNDRSGILFHTGAGLTSITGNLIGTNSSGTADLGNSEQGIRVSDSFQTTIGGITADARNVISGNDGIGISLFGPGISNTEILGNFIGTDLTGSVAIGNGSTGIGIYEATNTFIGALTPGAGNVISANLSGVEIGGSNSTNNFIDGNKIGTDVTGTINLGNTFEGVLITDNSNNNVRNNVVGYNDRGIRVSTSVSVATGNLISKNSVFPSGAGFAPIDLGSDSSTPNDVGDADTGPNNLQNYPELTSFTSDVSSTSIQGTLNSSPNTNFDLEFYSSPNCHSSGHGPGKTFIGTSSVITDASGNVSFDLTFPIPMPSGENFLTAIATNKLTDDTSEFSACLANNAGLLFDDFEDAVETWTFVKGNWGESAGSLIGNGPRATTYAPLPWPNSGLSGCTLCTIAVDFFTTDGGALGKVFLLLWFQDKKTKVELLVREKTDKWVLKEIVGGVVVNKKKGVHEIIPNVSKHVEITFDGANYHVTVEGTPLITMPSAAVPFGNVGFRMKNTGAWFQQILIQ